MTLRPDQLKSKDDLREAFRRHRRVLFRSPTGSGKTHISADLIRDTVAKGWPVLFLAPLQEIALDTSSRLKSLSIHCDTWLDGKVAQGAGWHAGKSDVVVALPWTLLAIRNNGIALPRFRLIIVDEAQHAPSESWADVLSEYPDAKWLLLTATPQRADGVGMKGFADVIVEGLSEAECVRQGIIAPVRMIVPPHAPRPKTLPCSAHAAWKRWATGPAIVFCQDVAHARREASEWPDGRSLVLTDKTPPNARQRARRGIAEGRLDSLCVVRIGVEGFNCHELHTSILSRFFEHIGAWLQAIGRCRRMLLGKPYGTVIDVCGSVYLHGMPDDAREWTLDGKGMRRGGTPMALRRCPECEAVFATRNVCPECGIVIPIAEKVINILPGDGALSEIKAVPHVSKWDATYQQLCGVGEYKMRKPRKIARYWAEQETIRRLGPREKCAR